MSKVGFSLVKICGFITSINLIVFIVTMLFDINVAKPCTPDNVTLSAKDFLVGIALFFACGFVGYSIGVKED